MPWDALKSKPARIGFAAAAFVVMGIGSFTIYVAGQANQFNLDLGNLLFWTGLAMLSIPFLMTEFTIIKHEDDIKELKDEVKALKKEIQDFKTDLGWHGDEKD